MNQKKPILLLLLLFCGALFSQDNGQDKKVVFIIVDGIAADMLEKVETPFLDQIAQKGGFTEAYVGGKKGTYSETPTISAVGYNSLITGTWVHKHNVFGNEIKAPNYRYPTVFRLYKDRYPEGKTAIFSTWLDNRTKLVGEGLEQTDKVKVDYAFDGFELDTLTFPHDAERTFIKDIDEKVAVEAARYIRENAPDLSWVYLEFTDDMGHKYGDGPQLYEAIAFEDQLIGKIWESIRYREENHDEEWLILITTDHGRSAKDGKHHGGQSDRERSTWIVTNSPNTNEYFGKHTPAVVDLLPTMVDFMDLNPDRQTRMEWDGVSLIKPVDAINLEVAKDENGLVVTWDHLSRSDTKAKLYYSNTNNFKSGGKDSYVLLGEADLKEELFRIPLPKDFAGYAKIVLETDHTFLNSWLIQTN
ncbi:MAG: alkaline phosphatase family protein [Sediminicola sp.]